MVGCTLSSFLSRQHDSSDPTPSTDFEQGFRHVWEQRKADAPNVALRLARDLTARLGAWTEHSAEPPSARQKARLWFVIAQLRLDARDVDGAYEAILSCGHFVPEDDLDALVDAHTLYADIADRANQYPQVREAWDQVIAAIQRYPIFHAWHTEILAYAYTRRAIAGVALAQYDEALEDIRRAAEIFEMWLSDTGIRLRGDATLQPHLSLQPTETLRFSRYADSVGMLARPTAKLEPRQIAHMGLLAAMIPWTVAYVKIWHARTDPHALRTEAFECFHLVREALWAGQALIPHHIWLARASMLIIDIASMGSWLAEYDAVQLRWVDLGKAGLRLAEQSWCRQIMAGLGEHRLWLIRLARIELALMQGIVADIADNISHSIREIADLIREVEASGYAAANVSRFIGKCWYVRGNAYLILGQHAEARQCLERALALALQGPNETFWPRVHEIERGLAML